ncbi:DUF6009 family protein [Streptomyces erythrochromogenes]|uniref:DUF6009 family protein n=1 Tax=Streptomyces erythrochromogenes TaxID=285574 RepID=UPI003426E0B2
MTGLIEPRQIAQEARVVWLEDIGRLDYVRQSLERLPNRQGRPPYHRDGRMVGYAVLGPGARASRASGTFLRRVFWLLPHDRDQQPEGSYAFSSPSEAVDPRTLRPRDPGRRTQRSAGPPSAVMRELGILLPER